MSPKGLPLTLKQTKKEDGRLVRGRETRERVLDAAERLFAELGFDGVSVRDIAAEAGVTLGVVGFHSGSKDDLFRTVLARRVDVLSRARLERLEGLEGRRKPLKIRDVVDAFVAPYVSLASTGGRQWRSYARLIASIGGEERWFDFIRELFDPVAMQFMDALRKLRPDADEQKLAAAYMMMVAATSNIVRSQARLNALARTRRAPATAPDLLDVVVDFCTAGIEAALRAGPSAKKPR